MAALTTAIPVATQHRRTAVLDGKEDAEVEPRQPGSVLFDEAVAMHANDIGHLERWPIHFLCSFGDRFTVSSAVTSILSSGVPAAFKCRCDKCR